MSIVLFRPADSTAFSGGTPAKAFWFRLKPCPGKDRNSHQLPRPLCSSGCDQQRQNHFRRQRQSHIPVFEFMRRFLQHVLPSGFHKVRYFGFMSPSNRRTFRRVQILLWMKASSAFPAKPATKQEFRCNTCGNGVLTTVGVYFQPSRSPP